MAARSLFLVKKRIERLAWEVGMGWGQLYLEV